MESIGFATMYPDNNERKRVFFQAALHKADFPNPETERHVLLWWINAVPGDQPITQIIQLSGAPGIYTVDFPVKIRDADALENDITSLGTFTRDQRNTIIQLAQSVQFNFSSRVNDCRVWMRDLLGAMVKHGLISQDLYNFIVLETPLPERRDE